MSPPDSRGGALTPRTSECDFIQKRGCDGDSWCRPYWSGVAPRSSPTSVPQRKSDREEMALEDPDAENTACEDGGRGHRDASVSRGTPRAVGPHRELAEGPSEPQKEPALPTADFGLPAHRTGREQIPAVPATDQWHLAVAQDPSWPSVHVSTSGERQQRHAPLSG